MSIITKKRGGARPNAGRTAITNKAQSRTIRLTDEQWHTFKNLYGASWLKALLDNAQQKSPTD